jgi:hypothetical protein
MSLWLALGAFTSAVTGIAILALLPTSAPSRAWEATSIAALGLYLVAAPLCHMVGAGFGVAALVRPNDRVKFGVVGILVNGGAVVLMIGSIIVAWTTIGFH